MHKIIQNSPDLFRSTSGESSSEFQLALALQDLFIEVMDKEPEVQVRYHNYGWEYILSIPQYTIAHVFSQQLIDLTTTNEEHLEYAKEILKGQLDKDWPLTVPAPGLPAVRIKNKT